ncbi:MAG: OmpA family protein [Pseudomonadota bacterium]
MSRRTKCACVGAAAGAAVGAGAGAVIGDMGHTHDNRLGGGIIGAAAGAVVGGVTGYIICKEEPRPAPVAAPAPKPETQKPVEEKIVLNGILFDLNKAAIKPEFYPILDEAVSALQKNQNKQVVIEGHTCSLGTESYNLSLSERRAGAVKKYLVSKGVNAASLSTRGYGEANPVADNKTKQGRKMNRRVEFKVIYAQ